MTTKVKAKKTPAESRFQIRYVPLIPRKIPAGLVLVHNFVQALEADHPPSVNGFRAWFSKAGDKRLAVCRCGWAPRFKNHYRVRGTNPRSVSSPAVKRIRKRMWGD
jgi:hypothetical protein